MAEKRIKWIDIARAFFIIAIVIGHTFSNPISNIRWFVFAFHVPAWFFLSGLCLNIESDEKITTYIKKKTRTIVLPYVLMSLLSIFVFFIAGKIIPRINTIVDSPLSNLKALLYSNSNQFSMRYNLPLWFLPCLFTTEVIGFSLEKIGKKLNLKLGVRIFAVMIAIVSSAWLSVYLPWHIETAISMLFWYELGIITQEYWSSFKHGSVVRSAKGHFVATVALIIMGGGG